MALSSYSLLRVGCNVSVKGPGHLARSFHKNNFKRDKKGYKRVTKMEEREKKKNQLQNFCMVFSKM